jgi:PAS domain-containing protein
MYLRKTEENLSQLPVLALFQRLRVGLATFGLNGTLTDLNQEGHLMLQLPTVADHQHSFKKIFWWPGAEKIENFKEIIELITSQELEVYLVQKPKMHVKLSGLLVGKQLMVTITDISEKVHMSMELANLKNQLKAFRSSSNHAHILISKDFKVIAFNKQASINVKTFYGLNLNEHDDFRRFIIPETEQLFYKHFNMALAGEVVRYELPILFPNGLELWFIVEYRPIYDEDGVLFGVSFNTLNENDLISTRKQLEEQNRKLKEIARMQSHDMRRPLASIMGIADLLKQENSAQDLQHLLNLMQQATNDLDDVIKRIVDSTSQE